MSLLIVGMINWLEVLAANLQSPQGSSLVVYEHMEEKIRARLPVFAR
jgi:hypothetical protein